MKLKELLDELVGVSPEADVYIDADYDEVVDVTFYTPCVCEEGCGDVIPVTDPTQAVIVVLS